MTGGRMIKEAPVLDAELLALKKRVKPLYAVGLEYKFFVMLSRLLPIRTIGWLLGLLYSGK